MIVEGIEKIHEGMGNILKLINEICEKEHLEYFLDGGSNIGAIRHNGFIPWDDDIDISLRKIDYLRLLEILKKDERFFLYFDDFKHHCCSFVFIKNNYWQSYDKTIFPNLYPIKLDIRPLNIIKNTKDSIDENFNFRKVAEYIIFGNCEKSDFDLISGIIEKFGSKEKFLEWYNLKYGIEDYNGDVKLVHPYLSYSKKDSLLKILYGNYMELPSPEERNSYSKALYVVKEKNIDILIKLYKSRLIEKQSFFEKVYFKLLCFFNSKLYKKRKYER